MKRNIIAVALLTFVNVMGFTILIPVLPYMVRDLGGNDLTFGILLSMYSLFQLVGSPVLGALSDHYGRRPILLISQLGTLLSWGIFAFYLWTPNTAMFGTTLPIIIIGLSRIVDGITGGNISVANAYLSDVTTRAERSQMFGIMGGMAGLGFIIGPAIGGFTAKYFGYLGTIGTAGFISFVTLILMYFALEESLPAEKRDPGVHPHIWQHINLWAKAKPYFKNKVVREVLQIHFFFAFVLSGYTSITSLFLIDSFQFDESQIAQFLFAVGTFIIINQVVFLKPLVKRFGEMKILLAGQFFLGLGLVLITQTTSIPVLLAFYYVVNFGVSISFPTIKSLLTKNVSEQKQGEVMGVDESIAAFCSAVAPASVAAIYHVITIQAFWVLSCVMLVSLAIFWWTSWMNFGTVKN